MSVVVTISGLSVLVDANALPLIHAGRWRVWQRVTARGRVYRYVVPMKGEREERRQAAIEEWARVKGRAG